MNLRIDPEFQNKIPPLTEAEFNQLEENIVTDGEVYEPIKVWNSTIIDGHNRWEIIQRHPEIPYKVKEMDFPDKWAAFDWMYKNQLGRRNLTDEQKTYLLGKLYEARKHSQGGNRGNQYIKVPSAQSEHLPTGRISEQIATEQNVGKETVKRAEIFAKGIDAIREEEPELAESILKAETKLPKVYVRDIGMAKPEERSEMVQAIKEGDAKRAEYRRRSKEEIKKEKEELQEIRDISDELFREPTQAEYTLELLLQDLELNVSTPFIRLLRQLVSHNKDICKRNKETIIKAIQENIVSQIEEIEKEIEGYE